MDIMLDSVGKYVLLKDNPEEYEYVINKQEVLFFCDTLIQTFKWKKDVIKDFMNEREKFITRLLDCILKLKEKDMLDNSVVFANKVNIESFMYTFRCYNLKSPSAVSDMYNLNKKISLLLDSQSRKLVIENMVKEEYFTRLMEY